MARRALQIPWILASATLASLAPLVLWDVAPGLFPARAHDVVAALPLALVAAAYLVFQGVRRVSANEFAKAALSAFAFVFWALNQLLPDSLHATLFNDVAIVAFVVDVVLVIVGWPPAPDNTSSDLVPRRAVP